MSSESIVLPAIPRIPVQLQGKDFLCSSTFRIGNDRRLSRSALKRSTFTKDYVVHDHYGRAAASDPPAPAEVMHRDPNQVSQNATESNVSFTGTTLPKVSMCLKLNKTNFKMDADDRVDSFHTTHASHYYPKPLSRSFPLDNAMKSYVPQGDKEKEKMPMSDYRDNFLGHDTNVFKVKKAPCMHDGGQSTIRGEDRTHTQFATSTEEQFPGRYLPYVAVKPDLLGSNIPKGDQEKLVHKETTQVMSYPKPGSANYRVYRRDNALTRLGDTNYKVGHAKKYDKFETTAAQSFQLDQMPEPTQIVSYDSNASSFPEGDRNPERVKNRVSTTNYTFYHKKPPGSFHNDIISGANKLTSSRVTFGVPSQNSAYYNTTVTDTYPAFSVPVERVAGHQKSKVPLDFYGTGQEVNTSTTKDNFPSWEEFPRHTVSKEALAKLRSSNITPPLHGNREFTTTHLSSYTAKKVNRYQYDSGKLQRSSVPLGTMTI
ncbi:stabilizer of axonemal microtubules 5-like [Asterias amurensis]|uniref:stabilizer of axonemal microtubules 5-like n=1 Tax=Asterias amurensis TaxID=7602 RepID=UPI003AB1970D